MRSDKNEKKKIEDVQRNEDNTRSSYYNFESFREDLHTAAPDDLRSMTLTRRGSLYEGR